MSTTGSGASLRRRTSHPYIGLAPVGTPEASKSAVESLNRGRENLRGPSVEVTYWFEVVHDGQPMEGIVTAAKMVLEHGTLKPWHQEGDASIQKPSGYAIKR